MLLEGSKPEACQLHQTSHWAEHVAQHDFNHGAERLSEGLDGICVVAGEGVLLEVGWGGGKMEGWGGREGRGSTMREAPSMCPLDIQGLL